jgi:oligopeptide transport system ATP-binding protein
MNVDAGIDYRLRTLTQAHLYLTPLDSQTRETLDRMFIKLAGKAGEEAPVLQVNHRPLQAIRAVDGVSFTLAAGETLGLVGETGSGKSTLGRLVLRLIEPSSGRLRFEGQDVLRASPGELRAMRPRMQMVFQDPYGSLDPRMTAGQIIAEPMTTQGISRHEARERVGALLSLVGLRAAMAGRYPHEFSGGQRQRIGIARAIALDPALVVLDEPVSALDVSVQAQILNLLAEIQARSSVSYLFIAHDLAVVRHVSDRVAVMYLGRIVEIASRDALYRRPRHPYTVSLLSAVPHADPVRERRRERIRPIGEIGSAAALPTGCRFHPRCPACFAPCAATAPRITSLEDGLVECHLAG